MICGKEEFTDEGGIERLLNPSLLIEVISKSTAGKDGAEKREAYGCLDSFQEYITIDSRLPLVTTYYKAEKGLWRIGSYYKMEQSVDILTLKTSIPMSTIYEGVVFDDWSHLVRSSYVDDFKSPEGYHTEPPNTSAHYDQP